jgi:alpha-beta hydrolase superfamily lysophospholipase
MSSVNLKIHIIFFAIIISLASCSFNQAYFNSSKYGGFFSDTVNYEEIYLKNKEGKELYACFFKPNSKPKGTVFLLTGNTGDVNLWYDVTSIMLKHNFQVFSFDYQGFGKSEGNPTHKNILTDSQLMLKYLRKREDIKHIPLIGWGFALGGNLAVKIAYDNQYAFDYLILDSPITSQRDMVLNNLPGVLKVFVFPFAKSQYASKKLIKDIKRTPILIIHSIEDQTVPYKMGEKLFEEANEPKYFFESLGPHGFALIDHEKLYMERVKKMIK